MTGDIAALTVDAPQEIIDAARRGAVFVFNISGGKDGLCATHAGMRFLDSIGHPRNLRHAMHADLGRTEWLETPETVERQATYFGLPLIVVRRPKGDLVAVWRQRYEDGLPDYDALRRIRLRGPWSGPGQKFCQPAMKRDQFVKDLRHRFPTSEVVSVIGVRRDESRDRSKAETFSLEKRLSTPGRTQGMNWNAIAHWTTPQVFEYADHHRLPMHEAYARWGSSRLSCALCVFSSKSDIQATLSHAPNHALLHTLVGMENEMGFAFQQNAWLSDARPDLLDRAQMEAASMAKAYSRERRALEAIVPDDFVGTPKGAAWPWRAPDREEADAISQSRRLVASWRGVELPCLTADAVIDRIGLQLRSDHAIAA